MSFLKKIEKAGKRGLKQLLLTLLPASSQPPLSKETVRRILVFRLDQRIGNGILLLPLLSAIRHDLPKVQLHYLIHHPVAQLVRECAQEALIDKIWPYHQTELLTRPWRFLKLISQLRAVQFDLVIISNNPDNFSLSQAILGRMMKPRQLVGFDGKDGRYFYDVAVSSKTSQHYSNSMIDLWRAFSPQADMRLGALQPSSRVIEAVLKTYPELAPKGIILWLGATGNKILPGDIFEPLKAAIDKQSELPVYFLAGPSDKPHLASYPGWVQQKTLFWKGALSETAALFGHHHYFISGDTGPMHLAAALNARLLTLFVDSNRTQYGYQNPPDHQAIPWENNPAGLERLNEALRVLFSRKVGEK